MITKPLQSILVLVFLAVIILILWAVPKYLVGHTDMQNQLSSSNCLLNHSSCTATAGEMSVSLSVNPQPLTSLKPLDFSATLEGIEAERVVLDLKGKDMYMGINQTEMVFDSLTDRWKATTELAVCTTGTMIWLADLKILPKGSDQLVTTTFKFEAK